MSRSAVNRNAPRSAVERILTGEWRRVRVTPLVVLAAGGATLDVSTTYFVLLRPEYYENNPVLYTLAEFDPLLATGYQILATGVLVLVAALALGWLSRVAGVFVIATNGTLGLNNAVLLVTDTALYTMIGIDVGMATLVITPVAGLVLGLAWEYGDHGVLWPEVVVAAAIMVPLSVGSHLIV